MNKIKTKIELAKEFAIDAKDFAGETSLGDIADGMAQDPYFEPDRVEQRTRFQYYSAAVVGALAIVAAATGRRKLAAGLGIWSAAQAASAPLEKRVSEHYDSTER